jgi:ribonuclease III
MINKITKEQINSLEKTLDYKFDNVEFLIEALTHPSMKQISPSVRDYERLELLGDSILGFLVTEMIFNKYKGYEEGNLAKIKAHVVSCNTLVKIANTLNLANYLIITQGEENSGGRTNPNNIENTMEALLAAIYLDSNIENVREIVNKLWQESVNNINFSDADPKTYLQELLQRKKLNTPKYELINQEGPVHAPLFTVKVSSNSKFKIGEGKSIKEAEKDAARQLLALLKLENNNV